MDLKELEQEINENLKHSLHGNKCQVIESGKDFTLIIYRKLDNFAKYEDCLAVPENEYAKLLKSIKSSNKKGKLNSLLKKRDI